MTHLYEYHEIVYNSHYLRLLCHFISCTFTGEQSWSLLKNSIKGGEMAQQIKSLTAKPEI